MLSLIKKIVYALCLLYTMNIILYNYGVVIPINLYTITIVSFTDIFGILGLIALIFII